MKLLYLSQGKQISDHPGYHDALLKLKHQNIISEYLNIPYFGFAEENGWDAFYNRVVNLTREKNFDVVYFQFFHKKGKPSPKECLDKLQSLSHSPIIVTSCGDPFSDNWMRIDYPDDFKELTRYADISFSTQMGKAADKMIKWGARNIVLSPHASCQVRFSNTGSNYAKSNFEYDVVFIGSNNGRRFFNPISKHWWGARQREKLVSSLHKKFGNRLGLFGKGWNFSSSRGPIPFNEQVNVMRSGSVLVGGNPYSYNEYYASNRPFFEVLSGIPTVELSVPRFENILRNNDHCYFVDDIDDLIEMTEKLLKEDKEELYYKSMKAAHYIEEKHTQYHRMKFELNTIKRYKKNDHNLDVNFDFFLPEIDLENEKKFAIRKSDN